MLGYGSDQTVVFVRRIKRMRRFMAALVIAIVGFPVPAGASQPIEGRDYTVVSPVQTTAKDKIEVLEFFSYQCAHCNSFAPALDAWSKKLPRDVSFSREAVTIGHGPWIPAARTFYTLQALGKLEALDAGVFKAIHQQGARFEAPSNIEAWMAQQKLPVEEFRRAYNSFGVETKVRRAETLSRTYRVPGIPTLIIDGKYLVAIASNVDYGAQLANVDALIARARADKKLVKPVK